MDIFAYVIVGLIVAFFVGIVVAGIILTIVAAVAPVAVTYEAVKNSKDSHQNR